MENKQKLALVRTFGCQQNVNDSERIRGELSKIGYGFTENDQLADLIIFNTCAIRQHAENKVLSKIGELKHLKVFKPNLIIGICGCMTQQDQVVETIKKSYPYVDFTLGTNSIHTVNDVVSKISSTNNKYFDLKNKESEIIEDIEVLRDDNIKASVPIMYGCDNYCAYCIVPYVRGHERSRESIHIIDEVKKLVATGFKDITLLGQNVNSYGAGLSENINFSELLRKINQIEGDFFIRFMTSHPKDATKELIDTMAECEKICEHIHLPIQCGSDRILELMNRKYTKEQYLEIVNYAKKRMPDIAITSDIIVGFPGEQYDDFLQTLDVIKQVEYNSLFTFIFSKREGTKAATLVDEIPYETKNKWLNELIKLQNTIQKDNPKKWINKTQKVLVDNYDDGFIYGKSYNNLLIKIKGSKELVGTFIYVKMNEKLQWEII